MSGRARRARMPESTCLLVDITSSVCVMLAALELVWAQEWIKIASGWRHLEQIFRFHGRWRAPALGQ
jgi:hypothetical protein